jgi:putative redox protein
MSQEIKVHYRQISASASEGSARGHKLISDRPEAKGGENRGPMGGEVFLLGLGGCFMSNLLAAVQSREAAASDLALEIAGTLEGTPARFSAVQIKVSGRYEDRAQMEKLVTIAERACIVANTIKSAVKLSFAVV